MAPPWSATQPKNLNGISLATHANPRHAFTPPPLVNSLTFTRPQLCLSMAMTSTLSGVPAPVLSSLATTMAYFLAEHVDDNRSPQELQFLDSVGYLADSTHTYFSSCVGVGIADLYAARLGYRFRCNSREVISVKGRLGDFLYDGGGLSSGSVVMVEAKGSLTDPFNPAAFNRTVENGYKNQVDPHIGVPFTNPATGVSLTVVHGYGIGCGGDITLGSAASCVGHVIETASPGGGGGSGGGGGGGGVSGGPTRSLQANAEVVLRNYLAVSTLLGAPDLSELIQRRLEGFIPINNQVPRSLRESQFRGSKFYELEFESEDVEIRRGQHVKPVRFAIWAGMLDALLENLANRESSWQMPRVPQNLLGRDHEDGGAVSTDGLALLPHHFEEEDLTKVVGFVPPEGGHIGKLTEEEIWKATHGGLTRTLPVRKPIKYES